MPSQQTTILLGLAALQHAVRSFHISARRSDESSGGGSNQPVPGNSGRARSQVASQRIQSLNRVNHVPAGQYKQVGLAGGSFPSGQTGHQSRVITPVRRPDSSTSSTGPRLQTPRVQARVNDRAGPNRYPNSGAGARRPGGYPNRFGPGARGGPGGGARSKRPSGGPRKRQRNPQRNNRKDDGDDGQVKLSDTVLRYLLSLKAARRAVKTYTPNEPTKEALISQSALSASLGQTAGAVALLEQRLRALADRAEMEPVPLLAQARRLVRGQFVKFADERERDAVMALVAEHQADIAARLSAKKGEEIAPKAIEFEELGGDVRQKTTDAVVAGAYAVHARATEPPKAEAVVTPAYTREITPRMLDLNGSYIGDVREKFLGRFNAVMGVHGAAASKGAAPKVKA